MRARHREHQITTGEHRLGQTLGLMSLDLCRRDAELSRDFARLLGHRLTRTRLGSGARHLDREIGQEETQVQLR